MIKDLLSGKLLKDKFSADVFYNFVSYGVVGGIGIGLNILIIRYYSEAALGLFTLAFGVYMLLSQVGVLGQHLSVLKHVPEYAHQPKITDRILTTALALALAATGLVVAATYLLAWVPAWLFDNPDASPALLSVLPGLFFFVPNKILLNYHNGARRMKAFAVFQSLRFIFVLLALVYLIYVQAPAVGLVRVFFWAEVALFVLLLAFTLRHWRPRWDADTPRWARLQWGYGLRLMPGNLMGDFNNRVSILVLGVLSTESAVGVLALASSIAEGFQQLFIVVRNNLAPVITAAYIQRMPGVLGRVLGRSKKKIYKLFVPLIGLAIAGYPVVFLLLGKDASLYDSWLVFGIICLGMALAAGYIPLQMVFNQTGFPHIQTWFMILVVASQLLLSVALIPVLGVFGAAAAMGLGYVSQILWLKVLTPGSVGKVL